MSIPKHEPGRLLGQTEAEQAFMGAWQSGRLHHGWLISGPVGIGKATLALRFAAMVLNAAHPETARPLVAGNHADLMVVAGATGAGVPDERQRPRTDIVLEDIRPITGFLRRTAAQGGWRVVIVDGADHLNRHAANALLKLLEEPPGRVLMLLTCSASGRLPPTIRSRCRLLQLRALDEAAMHEVLRERLLDLHPQERQGLIDLSGGSPGQALALAADDGVALAGLVWRALTNTDRRPGPWCYELADTVLRREGGFFAFVGLLLNTISTTIRTAVRQGGTERAEALLSLRSAGDWAETCRRLGQLRDETEALNLDKRQALLEGLSLLSG